MVQWQRTVGFAVILLIASLVVIVVSLTPGTWLAARNTDKIAHMAVYFFLTYLALTGFQSIIGKIISVILIAALGITLELAQSLIPGSDTSLLDEIANLAGIAAAGAAFWLMNNPHRLKVVLDTLRHVPRIWVIKALWISLGLALNHFLHTVAYYLNGAEVIWGFPAIYISARLSFLLVPTLLIASLAVIILTHRAAQTSPHCVLPAAFVLIALSQVVGRGIIILVFDLLTLGTLYANQLIESNFPASSITSGNPPILEMLHDELLTLLDISVSVFTFIWSVIGVAFALEFLRHYFSGSGLEYYGMYWYGTMVVFDGIGFIGLVSYTIFHKLAAVRNAYIRSQGI